MTDPAARPDKPENGPAPRPSLQGVAPTPAARPDLSGVALAAGVDSLAEATIAAHRSIVDKLATVRGQRDKLNGEIAHLVAEEARAASMAHAATKALGKTKP